MSGCGCCGIFLFLCGLAAMRHVEITINLEQVPDSELTLHPVFLHNFYLCLMSIFNSVVHWLHYWLLYDLYEQVIILSFFFYF